jgi:hypothetical protein
VQENFVRLLYRVAALGRHVDSSFLVIDHCGPAQNFEGRHILRDVLRAGENSSTVRAGGGREEPAETRNQGP